MYTLSNLYNSALSNPFIRLLYAAAVGAGAGFVSGFCFSVSPFLAPSGVSLLIQLWVGCVIPGAFFTLALMMVNHQNASEFSIKRFVVVSLSLTGYWAVFAFVAPFLSACSILTIGFGMAVPLWLLLRTTGKSIRAVWGIPETPNRNRLLFLVAYAVTGFSLLVIIGGMDLLQINIRENGFSWVCILLFGANYALLITSLTATLLPSYDDAPPSENEQP